MLHPHDHPRHAVPAAPALSLLRLSAGQRLIGVAGLILPLWGLVYWVLQ